MSNQHVAVIGAGIAGLQALRSLKERGVNVVCFDVADGCGGQWKQNYSSLHLQVPKEMYEFPDMTNSEVKWGLLPSCGQVHQQCVKYVEQFGLRPHIRYSTEVLMASAGQTKAWKLRYRKVKTAEEETEEEFDFVVLATGPFSHRQPYIPKVPGMEKFKGEILHSSANLKPNSENGKKVVVIGSAKSANDQAVQACRHGASSVTQIMRRAHWPCPQWVLGVIPFEYFFSSRFGEALVHTYQGSAAPPVGWSPFRRILNIFMRPIAWSMMKSFEYLFIWQLGLHGTMRPKLDIVKDFAGFGYTQTSAHKELREKDALVTKIGEIVSYSQNGINVREGGQELFYGCDMVIYGTGFEKSYDLFDPEVRKKLGDTSKGLCLYRQILHPELPNFAFVGSEFNTITNMTSSALQGEWVARWIAGDSGAAFRVSGDEMWAQIKQKITWKEDMKEENTSNVYNVDLQQINYGDTLLADMGESCFRKFPNFFAEFFMPYRSADYNGLVGMPLKHKSSGFRRAWPRSTFPKLLGSGQAMLHVEHSKKA